MVVGSCSFFLLFSALSFVLCVFVFVCGFSTRFCLQCTVLQFVVCTFFPECSAFPHSPLPIRYFVQCIVYLLRVCHVHVAQTLFIQCVMHGNVHCTLYILCIGDSQTCFNPLCQVQFQFSSRQGFGFGFWKMSTFNWSTFFNHIITLHSTLFTLCIVIIYATYKLCRKSDCNFPQIDHGKLFKKNPTCT